MIYQPQLEAGAAWAYSSVVEHCVDIAGVASSILATPTIFPWAMSSPINCRNQTTQWRRMLYQFFGRSVSACLAESPSSFYVRG